MSPNLDNIQTGRREGRYLTFSMSRERYGIEINSVHEIIRVATITMVPRSKPHIKGVINLRGKIIPVIDLRLKFSLPPIPYDEKTCIIVVNKSEGEKKIQIGVIVDTVLEVVNLDRSDIVASPDYGAQLQSEFLMGMGKKDDLLNILIDIEAVLESDGSHRSEASKKEGVE